MKKYPLCTKKHYENYILLGIERMKPKSYNKPNENVFADDAWAAERKRWEGDPEL